MQKTATYCRDNLADINTPLLYEQWYVAGLASEFTLELKERYLLDRSVLLYRTEEGEPIALQNRCAHRSFPLNESTLEKDGVRCGYHGIKYSHRGEITEVPCQTRCPKKSIHSYPIKEIGPLVWIWIGEPENADEAKIPETQVHDPEQWTLVVGDYNRVEGNYLLMVENLCDLTHIPYLHGETFKIPKAYAEIPIEVERDGHQVEYYRHLEEWGLVKSLFHPSVDFTGRPISYKSGGRFVSPGFFNGFGICTPLDEGDNPTPVGNYINHYLTPETQNTAHYFWYVARNYLLDDQEFSANFHQLITAGFEEDKFATGVMQKMLERDKHDSMEISIFGDQPGVFMRMAVKEMADLEYGESEE